MIIYNFPVNALSGCGNEHLFKSILVVRFAVCIGTRVIFLHLNSVFWLMSMRTFCGLTQSSDCLRFKVCGLRSRAAGIIGQTDDGWPGTMYGRSIILLQHVQK